MSMETCRKLINTQINEKYFKEIINEVNLEYAKGVVYPKKDDLFRAFDLCPYDKLKVIILGQDPYHEPNQANGLAFSVYEGIKFPPSLKNIFKELNNDLNIERTSGDLTNWAKQGVLMFNTCFSVREHEANSHRYINWDKLSNEIIKQINLIDRPIVFILWGSHAKEKAKFLNNSKHLVITSAHPSPLSAYRGFFDSKPFSKTNQFLIDNNMEPIDWSK